MTGMNRDYERRVETTESERIALAAAKLATNDSLNELFATFGVNRANVESLEEFKADLRFIRSIRQGSAKAGARFAMTIVTLFAGAFAYGLVEWLRSAMATGPGGK